NPQILLFGSTNGFEQIGIGFRVIFTHVAVMKPFFEFPPVINGRCAASRQAGQDEQAEASGESCPPCSRTIPVFFHGWAHGFFGLRRASSVCATLLIILTMAASIAFPSSVESKPVAPPKPRVLLED